MSVSSTLLSHREVEADGEVPRNLIPGAAPARNVPALHCIALHCIALPETWVTSRSPCQTNTANLSPAGIRVHLENKEGGGVLEAGFTLPFLPPCYVSKQRSTLVWCPGLLAQLSSWNNTSERTTHSPSALSSLGGEFGETGVSTCSHSNRHQLVLASSLTCYFNATHSSLALT